jgi:hypothetical protein
MCTGAEMLIGSSAALGAYGNVQQGKQAKKYYNYQADQAMADAEAERQMGEARAGRVRKAGVLAQSQVRAGYGASGVDVNTGTPVAVATQLQRDISSDALTELLTGQRRAASLQATAAGQRQAGANAQQAGYNRAAGSLLSGAAGIAQAREAKDRWNRRSEKLGYGNEEVYSDPWSGY